MTVISKVVIAGRSVVRRVPGVRPAWHAILRVNGQARSAAGRINRSLADRRRRTVASRPIDHPSARTRVEVAGLELRNRLSRRRAVSPTATAVVTVTTHGERLERAYLALESIARGVELPARLILWLDDPVRFATLPRSLRRLQRRGLEVRLAPNFKVHTKYYPYVTGYPDDVAPLVTADDDILYPSDWLADLLSTHRAFPGDVVAFRAHRMGVEDGAITPYATWSPASGRAASAAYFGTSVSGQVFPFELQTLLRGRGEAFRDISADNDDIWIHSVAIDAGMRVRLVTGASQMFPFVPNTQQSGLYLTNYWNGANDRQVAASYSERAIRSIEHDLGRDA